VQATEVKLEQVSFNAEFISRMIPRLEWPALCSAAESVSSCYACMLPQLMRQCSVNCQHLTLLVFRVCTIILYHGK